MKNRISGYGGIKVYVQESITINGRGESKLIKAGYYQHILTTKNKRHAK